MRWSGLGRPAIPLHFHALLIGTKGLSESELEKIWNPLAGDAQVVIYDPSAYDPEKHKFGAAAYCLKLTSHPLGNWDFGNLKQFRQSRRKQKVNSGSPQSKTDSAPPTYTPTDTTSQPALPPGGLRPGRPGSITKWKQGSFFFLAAAAGQNKSNSRQERKTLRPHLFQFPDSPADIFGSFECCGSAEMGQLSGPLS